MAKKSGCPKGYYKKGNTCVTEIPLSVVEQMELIIDYSYHDEAKHFAAEARDSPDFGKSHIFRSIAKVNKWISSKNGAGAVRG